MKNIFLIQTPKLGRLVLRDADNKLVLRTPITQWHGVSQNIYITNDDKIKEGDWFYDNDGELCKYTSDYTVDPNTWEDNKKIILTTDQDLIALGIQEIDETFLEWFVKNPSCEYVEVSEDYFKPSNMVYGHNTEHYKIIIPQR